MKDSVSESGVAEIVGSLMLIAIIAIGIAIAGLYLMNHSIPEKIPEFQTSLSNNSTNLFLHHDGGDSIPLSSFMILVNGNPTDKISSGSSSDWSIGDTLRLIGYTHNPTTPLPDVKIVYTGPAGDRVLADYSSSVSQPVPATTYTITAIAGTGGSISPSGVVIVNQGDSRTFTIASDSGYNVATLIVDGNSITPVVNPYTFTGVVKDHTISASFVTSSDDTYNLIADKSGDLVPGGYIQFRVTGLYSTITHGTTVYNLNKDDIIKLVITSDGKGTIDATSTQISSFNFDGVRLFINGVDKGVQNINNFWISGYDQYTSTLSIDVPYNSAWTQFQVNGINLINGQDGSRIQIFDLKPANGVMHLYNPGNGHIDYWYGATGYLITPPVIVANFTGSPRSGPVPVEVRFTDTSTGAPTVWSWDFGDGTPSAGVPSPVKIYSVPGTYNVSLTASNIGGSNTKTQYGYITALGPSVTVWAWIKWVNKPNIPIPTNQNNQRWATLVLDGSSDNNRRYHIQHDQNNTKFEFAIGTANMSSSGKWVQSTTNPANGTWYLVTGVYNQTSGKMAIYVNGTQEGSWTAADSSGLRGIPGTLQIGGIQAGYPNGKGICYGGSTTCDDNQRTRLLNGYVYGVQYFDSVKTPAEILAYYNAQGHPA